LRDVVSLCLVEHGCIGDATPVLSHAIEVHAIHGGVHGLEAAAIGHSRGRRGAALVAGGIRRTLHDCGGADCVC